MRTCMVLALLWTLGASVGLPKCHHLEAPQGSPLAPQAVMRQVFCDECHQTVNEMMNWCATPGNGGQFPKFCSSDQLSATSNPDQCNYLGGQIEKIYCPHNPCDMIRFAQGQAPRAVCDHAYIQCVPRPLKVPEKPKFSWQDVKGVSCEFCQKCMHDMINYCKEGCSPAPFGCLHDSIDLPEPGLCQAQYPDAIAECTWLEKAVGKMFYPQGVCDGLRCEDNAGKICNRPPINCGSYGNAETQAPVTDPAALRSVEKIKDYVLHFTTTQAPTTGNATDAVNAIASSAQAAAMLEAKVHQQIMEKKHH